mmetsp:Transcript_13078/g.24449  ORF Transcript_13078/g.24449 Transcript_13078/m.24449 type:complete len:317 (+) Transcript_13078:1-951(+)
MKKQVKWKLPPIIFCFVTWYRFFWGMNKLTSGELSAAQTGYMVLALGLGSGQLLTVTHEIFHKKDVISRVLGTAAMVNTLFMQFFIEHIYCHHKHVGTPIDCSTAKFGQPFYSHFWQYFSGTFVFSWEYEAKRLGTAWSLNNRNFWFFASELAFTGLIYKLYGGYGVLILLIQAVIGIYFMQLVNYVEHYGLERKEIAPGEYEPVTIKHSWNATHMISNYLFIKANRHSDHHKNPLNPYQNLCTYMVSPTLPCGYGVCLLVANFPPIWFAIIDPLAKQANEKGVVKAEDIVKSEKVLMTMVLVQSCLLTTLFFTLF